MTITRLAVQDFGGRTLEMVLSPATLLCGMNGSGKSTVIEALSVALTGALPGMRPRDMDVPTLKDLAGPSGRWSVTIMDSEGGMVRREFLGVQQRTRISAPNLEPLPDVNAAHEAAIATRYGFSADEPVGLVSMTLGNLLSMTPEQLRTFVVGLCARSGDGAQRWTGAAVRMELCRRVPDIADLCSDIEPCSDPVSDMDGIDAELVAAVSRSRSEVRALSARRKAEVPTPPADADIEALEHNLASHQKGRDNLIAQRAAAMTRREEYQRQLSKSAEEAIERQAKRDANAKKCKELNSTVNRIIDALDDAQAEFDVHLAAKPTEDMDAQKAEIAKMKEALPTKAVHPFTDKLREMEKHLVDRRAEGAKVQSHLDILADRLTNATIAMERFKSGECPTCGRPMTDEDVAPYAKNIEVIEGLIAETKKLREAGHHNQKELEKKIAKLQKEVSGYADQHALDTQAIAAAEADLTRKHIAHMEAVSAWDQKWHELEGKLAVLRGRKDLYTAEIAAAIKEGQELAVLPTIAEAAKSGASIDDEDRWQGQLKMWADHLAQSEEAVTELRAKLDTMHRALEAAEKAGFDKAEADAEYAGEQNWQAVLKQGQEALAALRTEVIGSFVGPLTTRVNELLDGYLGRFDATFSPHFALGMRRDGGVWVPLHRLSTGEFAIVSLAIAAAIAQLKGGRSGIGIVTFDDIEHLDADNLPMFLAVAEGLVTADKAAGTPAVLDQVVVAGRGKLGPYQGMAANGAWKVVDVGSLGRVGSGNTAAEQAA